MCTEIWPRRFLQKGYRDMMHMADPLSRAYLPLVKQDMMDTQEVWKVADPRSSTEVETEYVDKAESLPIRKLTLQHIKSAAEVDAELQVLVPIIRQGWPERRAQVPCQLQAYFPFREELSIQDGVVFGV